MVEFGLLNESTEDLLYAYHFEYDYHLAGIVAYSPNNHALHIIEHAVIDRGTRYAHSLVASRS